MNWLKQIRTNSWLTALVSWLGATVLVTVVYTVYNHTRGTATDWTIVRNAAGIAALLALVNAFRDRGRRGDD